MTTRREGKTVYHSIAGDDIKRVITLLDEIFRKEEGQERKNPELGAKVVDNRSRKESLAPGAPGRSLSRRKLSGPVALS